jgi:hypothetical protein
LQRSATLPKYDISIKPRITALQVSVAVIEGTTIAP